MFTTAQAAVSPSPCWLSSLQSIHLSVLPLLCYLLTLAIPFPAGSEETPFWRPNGNFTAGAFYAWGDSGVTFKPSVEDAINAIDLEDDFGLDEEKVFPLVDFVYRFGRKHMINASYFAINRDDSTTLSDRVAFDDFIFEAGAQVKTRLDTNVFRIAYGYNFYRRPNAEIGVLAGLHWTEIDIQAKLQAGIAETRSGESVSIGSSDNARGDIPFPTFGLRGDLDFNETWSLGGWAQLLYVDIGDVEGYLWNSYFAGAWHPVRNFGVQLGYFYFGIDIDYEDDQYRYWFWGPALMLEARF